MGLFDATMEVSSTKKLWAVILGRKNEVNFLMEGTEQARLNFVIDGVAGYHDSFRIMSHYGDLTEPGSEVLTVNVGQVFRLTGYKRHPENYPPKLGFVILPKTGEEVPGYITHIIHKIE